MPWLRDLPSSQTHPCPSTKIVLSSRVPGLRVRGRSSLDRQSKHAPQQDRCRGSTASDREYIGGLDGQGAIHLRQQHGSQLVRAQLVVQRPPSSQGNLLLGSADCLRVHLWLRQQNRQATQ